MSNEGYLYRDIETRSHNDSISNNGEFIPPSDGSFKTSTPQKGRSVSYVDVSSFHDEGSPLSDLSWQSQRMRGLSQSICDLKILREKQMERRQTSILFEDNLLQEHAKKLQEARMKIKALEAKYSSPQRLRSNLRLPTGKNREASQKDVINTDFEKPGCELLGEAEENTVRSPGENSLIDKIDIQFSKTVWQRSLHKEQSDDRSDDIDGDRSISEDKPVRINLTKTKKRRPVTWADDEDQYSSDCNSVSSYGSAWRKLVEIIPEREAHTYTEGSRCLGYTGTQKRLDMNDNTSNSDLSLSHRQTIVHLSTPTPTPTHNASGHKLTELPNTAEKTKWHSMPNLPTHDNEFNENRKMMYGEAIPVDPHENERKQNTKFGRKSGLYVVNDSTEENQQPLSTSKKQKFRKMFFNKNGSSKKNPSKYITVSAPKEPQSIGRLVGLHPTVKSAYVIELNRLATGSFGLLIQKGYRQYRKGIFVYRIADKKVGKFFGGLVHVGDEVLEVNDKSVQEQNLAFVNKLIKNSDKLQLTILPFLSRKD